MPTALDRLKSLGDRGLSGLLGISKQDIEKLRNNMAKLVSELERLNRNLEKTNKLLEKLARGGGGG